MRGDLLVVGVLVGLALSGSALAGWRSSVADLGEEPNTRWDVPSTMWAGAAQAPLDRIYFDAIVDAWSAPFLPHVSTGQPTRLLTWHFSALLGYWRDCNGDGFIGDARTGGASYPVDVVAPAGALCQAGTAYNDGFSAYEFLAIGPWGDAPPNDEVPAAACSIDPVACTRGGWNAIRDDAASVWQDWGPPGSGARSDETFPFPQGTLSDTNGHFQSVDGFALGGFSGTGSVGCDLVAPHDGSAWCWLWPSKQGTSGTDSSGRERARPNQCKADATLAGIADALQDFPDAPRPERCPAGGTSPIPNIEDPVAATVRDRYNDSLNGEGAGPSGTPIVQPWGDGKPGPAWNADCELRTSPLTWEFSARGALYPTVDHVYRGAVAGCSARPASKPNPLPGNLEAPRTSSMRRVHADDSGLRFVADAHYNPSGTTGLGDVEVCLPTQTLGHGHAARCGGQWTSRQRWVMLDRPHEPIVATLYADVNFRDILGDPVRPRFSVVDDDGNQLVANDPRVALPARIDGAHTYGEENCATGRGTSDTGRWECSPLEWLSAAKLDASDPANVERIHLLPVPGKRYDLRDVECLEPITRSVRGDLALAPPSPCDS